MEALQPLLLLFIFGVIFYFIGIRPQKRRQQQLAQIVSNLKPGDEVITVAGIHGTVSEVEPGGTLLIEVAEDTDIRIESSSILRVTTDEPAVDPTAAITSESSDK